MERDDQLHALRREGAALAEAAQAPASLGLPVPSCPEWTMADLLWHTAEVADFWTRLAEGSVSGPEQYVRPERPADADLPAWYLGRLDQLERALAPLDPSTPVWTWSSQQDAGFLQRRMAQEFAVHRWDGTNAAGRDEPIEPGLAADGVDEFLEFFLHPEPPDGLTGSVTLHATDATDTTGTADTADTAVWRIEAAAGAWRIDRGEDLAPAEVTVRGGASDLLLLLWRRRTPAELELSGDEEVLNGLLAASRTS